MKLTQVRVSLSDGSHFDVWLSHPEIAEAAVINWEVRTKEYTDKSLCEYINSKRKKGMADYYAFTNTDLLKARGKSKTL